VWSCVAHVRGCRTHTTSVLDSCQTTLGRVCVGVAPLGVRALHGLGAVCARAARVHVCLGSKPCVRDGTAGARRSCGGWPACEVVACALPLCWASPCLTLGRAHGCALARHYDRACVRGCGRRGRVSARTFGSRAASPSRLRVAGETGVGSAAGETGFGIAACAASPSRRRLAARRRARRLWGPRSRVRHGPARRCARAFVACPCRASATRSVMRRPACACPRARVARWWLRRAYTFLLPLRFAPLPPTLESVSLVGRLLRTSSHATRSQHCVGSLVWGLTCRALVAHEPPCHAAVAHGAENKTRRRAAAVPLSRKRCFRYFHRGVGVVVRTPRGALLPLLP
jgi:hypothetical protein